MEKGVVEREFPLKRWVPKSPSQKLLVVVGFLAGLVALTHAAGGFDVASQYLAARQAALEAEKKHREQELLKAAAEEMPNLAANYPKNFAQRKVLIYGQLAELRPENKEYRRLLAEHQAALQKITQEEFAAKQARLQAEKEAEEHARTVANRQKQIERQFSSWDGSHRRLERYIKSRMNDPDSYEHISTRFVDNGDSLLVTTKFRGRNAFGGMVINHVTATVSLDGNVQEIVSWGQ